MDASRFDALLRSLTASPSRRGVGQIVGGLLLEVALRPLGGAGADARRRKKKKKKKRPTNPCQGREDGVSCGAGKRCFEGRCCSPTCEGRPCNSSDDCGGDCTCETGQACLSGTCGACPEDAECANTPCGETNAGDPCRCVVSVDEQPACVSANLADGVLTDENCSDTACTTALGKQAVCIDFECSVGGYWCLPDCGAA